MRVSLAKYFIPGCIGEGSGWDLRVCPAAPTASGNPGFCLLGIEVEKQGFRTAWLITGQKFQGVGLKLTAFMLTFRDPSSDVCQTKHMRMVVLTDLELGSCSRIWDFSNPIFGGNLQHQGWAILQPNVFAGI